MAASGEWDREAPSGGTIDGVFMAPKGSCLAQTAQFIADKWSQYDGSPVGGANFASTGDHTQVGVSRFGERAERALMQE